MVGVIFNYIVVDMAALGATFGTRLDIDVSTFFLLRFFVGQMAMMVDGPTRPAPPSAR